MCFQRLRPQHRELQVSEWYDIIDRLARFKPRIHLSGGEPFLYQGIADLIEYIKEKKLFLTITTNGTLLGEHAERLVKRGVNRIHLSIDGPRDVHDGIRGVPGTFDKLITGLAALTNMKKGMSPLIRINSMIDPHNIPAMHEVVRIAQRFNAECVQFLHPLGVTKQALEQHRVLLEQTLNRDLNYWRHADRGCGISDFSDAWYDEMNKFIKTAASCAVIFPSFTRAQMKAYYTMDREFYSLMRGTCAALWQTATILPSGDVESCPDYIFGNCSKEDFLKLWNVQIMRQIRKRIRAREFFTVCRACCYYYQ